jgi:Glycosyl hydrolase family 12
MIPAHAGSRAAPGSTDQRRTMTRLPIHHTALSFGLAALAALCGCSGGGDAPEAAGPGIQVIDCTDNAAHATPLGTLINNTWNKRSAGEGPWRQCLRSRLREGRTEYGWSWLWPSRDGLYAYPSLLVGSSPWSDKASNDPRFPRRIADTRAMRIDFDTESQFDGKKNLAAEFWFTRTAPEAGKSNEGAVTAELMIWNEASQGLVSEDDKPAAEVEIDGARWVLYVKRNWGEVSGGTSQRWTFITYHAVVPAPSARYDARKFFQDAIDRGLLAESDVIAGVEFGNELVSGSGSTWIKRFELTVQ